MKSLTANFTTEKNKRGTGPLSLLEIDLPSPLGTLRLAGHDVTVGTDEYKGLVKEWPDRIYSRVSGDLHTPDIGDVRITLVNTGDGAMAPFMRYLQAVNPEGAAARIYQWFSGLVAADKDQVFTGVVRGPIEWNEETLSFDIVSGVSKDRLVGDRILASAYPSADLDEIGRILPIVYGTLENFPCLATAIGATDMLRSDLAEAAGTIELSDASRFPDSGDVIIGSDTITYTGKSGDDLTGATGGLAHKLGDVVWESRASYDFKIANQAVKSITDVRVNGLLIPGANYTADLADAQIEFNAHPINAFLSEHHHDVGITHSHNISTSHSSSGAREQYPNGGYSANWYDGNNETNAQIDAGSDRALTWPNTSYGTLDTVHWWLLLRNTSGSVRSLTVKRGAGGPTIGTLNLPANSGPSWYRVTDAGASWSSDLGLYIAFTGVYLHEGKRLAEYTPAAPTTSDTSTGPTMDEDGKQVPGLDFWRGALVTCTVAGKEDDGSGTITGTPNALIERPDHVFKDFLINVLGHASGDIDSTSFDASGTEYNTLGYLFAGAITQPEQARDVLARLAFQCRSWFFWDTAGKAHLVLRELYAAPDKGIGREQIIAGSLRLMRTSTEDIRNKISLHYVRDYAVEGRPGIVDPELPVELREPEKGFKSLSQSSNSGSDTDFGTKERAYYFDFVVADAMADDLAGFYLSLQAYPRSRVAFKTYLPNYELERGDRIGLTHTHFGLYAHNFELISVSQILGSGVSGRMDAIAFVAEGRAIKNQKIGGRSL